MVEMTQEDIERLWNSVVHFIPEKQNIHVPANFLNVPFFPDSSFLQNSSVPPTVSELFSQIT